MKSISTPTHPKQKIWKQVKTLAYPWAECKVRCNMENKFFTELSRCLEKEEIKSVNQEDKRLEVFLHGQPVLFVSPANDVFLLPAGSKNEEASE